MKFFEGVKNIFFVGIGGIGVSALARFFKSRGFAVVGSDLSENSITNELVKEGIAVSIGHGDLPKDCDLLIYSEAVPLDNIELKKARDLNIPVMTYFEALGKVAESFHLVAVAGTHGKSTTTSMLGLILTAAGLDPTVIVGTKVNEFGGKNIRVGESDLMLVEACEYRRNFLHLRPDLLGILNVEMDHLDYFKSYEDYEKAFHQLADQSKEVVWPDDLSEYEGELTVPGEHNLLNAAMAANLARKLQVPELVIAKALKEFSGVWRRFEYCGTSCGALVYDDYAHHPSEITATLQAAREKHPDARIVAVFQPHQYSRTAALFDDFAESFDDADEVIIADIYEARDTDEDKAKVSAEKLAEAIPHDEVQHISGLDKIAHYLLDTLNEGDMVLVMGAGNITNLVPMILDEGGVGGV